MCDWSRRLSLIRVHRESSISERVGIKNYLHNFAPSATRFQLHRPNWSNMYTETNKGENGIARVYILQSQLNTQTMRFARLSRPGICFVPRP